MMRRVYALVVGAVLIGAVMVALHAGDSSATTVPPYGAWLGRL